MLPDDPSRGLHCGLHIGPWRRHRDDDALDLPAVRLTHRHGDGVDELTPDPPSTSSLPMAPTTPYIVVFTGG